MVFDYLLVVSMRSYSYNKSCVSGFSLRLKLNTFSSLVHNWVLGISFVFEVLLFLKSLF